MQNDSALKPSKVQPVDWEAVMNGIFRGKTVIEYGKDHSIFRQGQPADALFYIRHGMAKLSVLSQQGREAIIRVVNEGEFFGEGCLAGQKVRAASAVAITDCTFDKIEKSMMEHILHDNHDISEMFVNHLLKRNIQYEADLVDQFFNSSEKRLARTLLLLSHFGKGSRSEPIAPRLNQDTLAQMVGTTRSRVSHFMKRFRENGFIDYDGGRVTVHSGLMSVVIQDKVA